MGFRSSLVHPTMIILENDFSSSVFKSISSDEMVNMLSGHTWAWKLTFYTNFKTQLPK